MYEKNTENVVNEMLCVRKSYEGSNLRTVMRGGSMKFFLYKGIPTEPIFKNHDAPTSR